MDSFAVLPHSISYLLVYHGSRDPRPQAAADALAGLFFRRIKQAPFSISVEDGAPSEGVCSSPSQIKSVSAFGAADSVTDAPLVGTACLECGPLPLYQQVMQFGETLKAPTTSAAVHRLIVLPLFLLPGVHVMEDIPAEIALAQSSLGQVVEIEVSAHLGCHPKLHRLLTEKMATLPVEAWVLLAHGSRRLQANQPIEALAARLGAVTAYWSVAPSLASRLQELRLLGLKRIAVLPYFLFTGTLTDAIAQTVTQLTQQFPDLDLHLATPLDASPEIADLLVDLARQVEKEEF